jgi:hypothetical protein
MDSVDQVHMRVSRPWQPINLIRDFELLLDDTTVIRVKNG